MVGTGIGNATLVETNGGTEAKARGFYATAYDVSNVSSLGGAHTVVSYRGTDFAPASQFPPTHASA